MDQHCLDHHRHPVCVWLGSPSVYTLGDEIERCCLPKVECQACEAFEPKDVLWAMFENRAGTEATRPL